MVKCQGDVAFADLGRQELTAPPYALYALGAPWAGLTGVPADLADGDDDTTYTAGMGLVLDSTTFNVTTSTIQQRVSGACTVGSTIRAVNADGTVVCEPHDTCPVFSLTTLDSAGNVGAYTSVAIGADGLGLIGYRDETNSDLKAAHCNDIACTAATLTTMDSVGGTWTSPAVTIGTDGLGLIGYHDGTDLKLAHCSNTACTTATLTTLDSAGDVGYYSSVIIGADGLGLISYYDSTNADLKVAHCSNATCTAAISTTLDSSSDVGFWNSVTIGADRLPLISYYNQTTLPSRWPTTPTPSACPTSGGGRLP